jgi:uncharacterized protein (TIGR04255 family)
MYEIFPRAPITEALIDIRIDSPIPVRDLEALYEQIQAEYPVKKPRRVFEAQFHFPQASGSGYPKITDERKGVDGYLFQTQDSRQVVQFRSGGFTFSRLQPYTAWEQVFPEAMRLWGIYRIACKSTQVIRVAVRYLNSIEIPLKSFDYDEYFTAAPQIPPGLPQSLHTFFSRIAVPFEEHSVLALISLAPKPIQPSTNTAIILDIDVFREVILKPADARISEILGHLREIKNRIFFSSITEKTKELFR